MQIKTKKTYHFTNTTMGEIKTDNIISLGENVENWNTHPFLLGL